ncbi:MAG: hypothetical protein EA396_11555 [Anaerolineaceae bacterium]|nr:MAG: hypothetical protein EA396_11555 [Anaerolineaceae bacterium]
MADTILKQRELEAYIGSLKLVVGSGGVFKVTVNGEVLFDKKALGRHAEPGEAEKLVADRMNALIAAHTGESE